jgi:predicted site-specific integrase-resolvase
VPLQEWAKLLMGEHAPHNNTLLRWVHEGRIQPQPVKIGRKWFVRPDAEYISD